MRVAVLVKQVPRVEEMELLPDGRLNREGVELEMNAYCRRAVSKGVEIARESGGTCTVFTLGPPGAEDTLREAVAWGADEAVLVTDQAFAGSDTLATARAWRPPSGGRVCSTWSWWVAIRSTPTPAKSAPRRPSCSISRSPEGSGT